jgi:hypothetical protein
MSWRLNPLTQPTTTFFLTFNPLDVMFLSYSVMIVFTSPTVVCLASVLSASVFSWWLLLMKAPPPLCLAVCYCQSLIFTASCDNLFLLLMVLLLLLRLVPYMPFTLVSFFLIMLAGFHPLLAGQGKKDESHH